MYPVKFSLTRSVRWLKSARRTAPRWRTSNQATVAHVESSVGGPRQYRTLATRRVAATRGICRGEPLPVASLSSSTRLVATWRVQKEVPGYSPAIREGGDRAECPSSSFARR